MHILIMVMDMSKLDEFKEFAHTLPHLKELVKKGKFTWQELYERYDIYGKEDEVFIYKEKDEVNEEETQKEEKKEGLDSLLQAISGFDVEKISEGLSGMKKILNVLSEVTRTDEPILSKRKTSKPYQRNDD